jgi:hypothetical protein
MKKAAFFFFLLMFGSTSLFCAVNTTPYSVLRYNSSARASGLAGAMVAMPDDPTSVFYNPASIATVEDKPLSFTFLKHVLDINSGNVTYIKKYDDIGTFGASVIYTNYGSFDETDNLANKTGTFSANDMIFDFSYANQFDTNLYYGASLKFIYSNLSDMNSLAFALDAGLFYKFKDGRSNFGLSILNAGAQISRYNNLSEDLPLDIRIGINHRLVGLPLLLNFSFHHLADETDKFMDKLLNFSLGGEIYFGKYVQGRIGYDNYIRKYSSPDNSKKMSGFSGGFGIKTKNFDLDYSVSAVGTAASLHRFGLRLNI